jgi:hypothetical protein
MPNATDLDLLLGTKGLAVPQIIEVQILDPQDGAYTLGLAEFDPIVFNAAGSTILQIRDGLAAPIVSPDFDPLKKKLIGTDRFQVKGAPGDPFDAWLTAPDTGDPLAPAAKLITVQDATGAPTTVRLFYLSLVEKLIKPDGWGDLTLHAQVILAAYFIEAWILAGAAAEGVAAGGNASSMSLGPASVGLSGAGAMPSASQLESSSLYGAPFLVLYRARIGGPIWS